MIINVKKYLILGVKEEIDLFFERAQEVGVAEFIAKPSKKREEHPVEIVRLLQAMKILRKLPVKLPVAKQLDLVQSDETAGRIILLKEEVERLYEEIRLVETEMVRIAPFGDFSLSDLDFIEQKGGRTVQFFCQKSHLPHDDPKDEGMIYVGSEYDLDYYLSIQKETISREDKIEMRIDRPLGELKTHLQFVKDSLHQMEAELKGYAGYLEILHDALLERLNRYNLMKTKKEIAFPMDNGLFSIEAWVPDTKLDDWKKALDPFAVHCEEIAIETDEKIPTYVENQGSAEIGEDLVNIYDVPASTDKDPAGWVFWCFVVFFSMIVNDGGYGFLYLGICLYAKYKFKELASGAKRFLRLAITLSVGCIIWGVLSASFFGLEFSPKSWVSKLSGVHYLVEKKAEYHMRLHDDVYEYWVKEFPQLATATTGEQFVTEAVEVKHGKEIYPVRQTFADNIFLEFALVVGMIHISLSLLRYSRRHLAAIGWVIFIVGGYLFFPSLLQASSFINTLGFMSKKMATDVGLQAIYTGIAVAVLLALLQKRMKGVGEISTLISVFADILSYLRLYALGLSTAIMAETFNELGQEVGLFLGALVILAGHAITIAMGLMTGVIHGLRLNFIEWYHYSFDGGGRLLAPLRRFQKKE